MLPLSDFPVKFLRWKIRFFICEKILMKTTQHRVAFMRIYFLGLFNRQFFYSTKATKETDKIKSSKKSQKREGLTND